MSNKFKVGDIVKSVVNGNKYRVTRAGLKTCSLTLHESFGYVHFKRVKNEILRPC